MKTYTLVVRETYDAEIEVEAESADEAVAQYENGNVDSGITPPWGGMVVDSEVLNITERQE